MSNLLFDTDFLVLSSTVEILLLVLPFTTNLNFLTDAIIIFLLVATVAGVISSKLGMPALTGEIFTGFLLGPPLGEFKWRDPRHETFGQSHQLLLVPRGHS